MILSVHSSAEEMVASITVNDPGKCFKENNPAHNHLKRQIGNEKMTFKKKEREKRAR